MKIGLPFLLLLYFGTATICDAQPSSADRALADQNMKEYYRMVKFGEEEKALRCITKAINLCPSPPLYRERADLYMNIGKPDLAMLDTRSAIKVNPNDAENLRTLARVYAAQGNTTSAIKAYGDAISRDPHNTVFRYDRARLFERTHDYAKAAEDYTVTIDFSAKHNRSKFYEARGACYMKTKEYKKAIVDFTGAIADHDGRSKLLRDRAQAYKMLGDSAMEKKDLRAADAMDEVFQPPATLGEGK